MAKVNPCKGWMQANSQGEVVNAATPQRITRAPLASVIDQLQPIRRTSQGPISRNTTTSANTDSDQSALMVKKFDPRAAPADHLEGMMHRMAAP